jgi:hypothetical protein
VGGSWENLNMIKITKTEEKLTPAKQNIKLDGIFVKDLKFVDETGDITQQVLDALPEGTEQVGFKITVELPLESEEM